MPGTEIRNGAIAIRLLGRLQVCTPEGVEIPIPGARLQALLGYLACRPGRGEHRDRLAMLLWSDRGQEQARHSLRQAVLTLRRALGPSGELLGADAQAVWLEPGDGATDVARFEAAARREDRESLREAAALYRGEALEGLAIASEPFAEWLAAERERLRAMACGALRRLAEIEAAAGEAEAAMATARRALALDAAFEECHRLLIGMLHRSGQRTAALRQYQACVAALRREVDAEPAAATQRLAEAIRRADAFAAAPAAAARAGAPGLAAATVRRWPGWALIAAIAVPGFAALPFLAARAPEVPPPAATAGAPSFPLPDRPSIVVLPFRNVSGDPVHAPLVDGITEEITAALTMVSGMFVISRMTAMTYRDRQTDIAEVARALGVRYVLDGSVLVQGGDVRVIANLADAATNRPVWSHRHETREAGVFELNDALVLEILTGLNVHLAEGEQERISLVHGTRNLQAWLLAGRALQHIRRFTPMDNAEARRLYRAALDLAPDYPGAAHGLAWTHFVEARFGWSEDPAAALAEAARIAQATLALDPNHPASFSLLGGVALAAGQHARAVALAERAVALSPNGADVTAVLAFVLTYAGDPARAAMLLDRAMRLSPYYPDWYRWVLGRAFRLRGDAERAVAVLTAADASDSGSIAPLVELALSLAAAGRPEQARAAAARVALMAPGFSAAAWLRMPAHADPAANEEERRLMAAAGFPE